MTLINSRDGFISQYISLCVGAVLYGAFLVSIPGSIRAFVGQGKGKWWIHVLGALLFLAVTLDIGLLNARLGLTVLRCYMCGPDYGESCDPIPWFNRAQTFIVAFCTLLTESAMIYRCWLLHYKNWIVIAVPSLLWVHGLGVMIYTTIFYPGSTSGVGDAVQIGFWVLTTIMKVMTTALIIRRVHETHTEIDKYMGKAARHIRTTTLYTTVMKSIVESGSMCIVASLFVLASRFVRIVSVLAPTVMIMVSGISFNLIPVRVEQYRRKDAERAVSTLYFSTDSLLQPPKAHMKSEP